MASVGGAWGGKLTGWLCAILPRDRQNDLWVVLPVLYISSLFEVYITYLV